MVEALIPCLIAALALLRTGASEEGPPAPLAAPSAEVRSRAAELDRRVEEELRRRGLRPNPIVDDATFLRRTTLTVAGRIPTLEEEERFRADPSPDKRHALVDTLLAGRGYESHFFHWYADLLRVRTKLARDTSGEPYAHFVKDAIARNRPFDEVVRELLTATGPAHAEGNGATGYALRDRGMPEDNLANTMRVFLGTRIECAQCHDHPFESWKQRDFFRLVAFSGGLDYAHDEAPTDRLESFGRELRNAGDPESRRAFRRMIRPVRTGVSGTGTGVAALPLDYRYEDAAPGSLVAAATPFGAAAPLPSLPPEDELENPRARRRAGKGAGGGRQRGAGDVADRFPEIGSREVFADWVTSPENPRFTTVIANRMWRRIMGVGVIEPVDDLRDDTAPSDPALQRELERLIEDLGYDLREFQRVLLHTDLWQREAAALSPDAPGGAAFVGPALRRLTAEQLWDSLVTLVVPDVDATLDPPDAGARAVYDEFERARQMTDQDLEERLRMEMLRLTDRKQYLRERSERRAEARAEGRRARTLAKRLSRARQRGREGRAEALFAELLATGRTAAEIEQMLRGRGLERASDLPSPVEPGHFLWQFGQSEREQVEASHQEANVPQVLNLLNGFVEEEILARPNAVLLETIDAEPSPEGKVDVAWRAVLGRAPSAAELDLWRDDVGLRGAPAVHDLVWTLLNTHEFRFLR